MFSTANNLQSNSVKNVTHLHRFHLRQISFRLLGLLLHASTATPLTFIIAIWAREPSFASPQDRTLSPSSGPWLPHNHRDLHSCCCSRVRSVLAVDPPLRSSLIAGTCPYLASCPLFPAAHALFACWLQSYPWLVVWHRRPSTSSDRTWLSDL